MSYTYPVSPAVSADLTSFEVNYLFKNPTLIADRLYELSAPHFIADYLLANKWNAEGGAVATIQDTPHFNDDDPDIVAPLSEYPTTSSKEGKLVLSKVAKWGQKELVSDESVTYQKLSPIERALYRMSNSITRKVDRVAMAVIGSSVTQTYSASGAWATSIEALIEDVMVARATVEETQDVAYNLDTVVLKPTQFAKVIAKLVAGKFTPQETHNVVLSGTYFDPLGLTWTTTKHMVGSDPIMLDRNLFGGMVKGRIDSPGYVSRKGDVEIKVSRLESQDGWALQGRRVTVPVIYAPNAALALTGTGI